MSKSIRRTTRLALETLEDRLAPAVAVFYPNLGVSQERVSTSLIAPQIVQRGQMNIPVSQGIINNTRNLDSVLRSMTLTKVPGSAALSSDSLLAHLFVDMNRNGSFDPNELIANARPTTSTIAFNLGTGIRLQNGTAFQVSMDISPTALISSRFGVKITGIGVRPVSGSYTTSLVQAAPALHTVINVPPPPPPPTVQLFISQKMTGTSGTVVRNQSNVTLLRYEATAQNGDVVVNSQSYVAQQSNALFFRNYALWSDTDNNGVVDTILEKNVLPFNGRITFDNFAVFPRINSGQPVVFELHADAGSFNTSTPMQFGFDTSSTNYIVADHYQTGQNLVGIVTNGVGSGQIHVSTVNSIAYTIAAQGSLFVSQDVIPLRPQQLLGGTVSDPVLRLMFSATDEAVKIQKIAITSLDSAAQSVDRLELYFDGAQTPFVTATLTATGNDNVPQYTFTARMMNNEFILGAHLDQRVLVKVRMRDDFSGAFSGEAIRFYVSSDPVINQATGEGAIFAQGVASSNSLFGNNGDNVLDGEVIIGRTNAGFNNPIIGSLNTVVLSRIDSVENANTDPNGTPVPSGTATIGAFKFSGAANTNSQNGYNKSVIQGLVFTVSSGNIQFDGSSFVLYNQANATVTVTGQAVDLNGTPLSGVITGNFYVVFSNLGSSIVSTTIDPNSDITLALKANVLNNHVTPQASGLQVSLDTFNDANKTSFGPLASHIQWTDRDASRAADYFWVMYGPNTVKSTSYNS